MAYFTDDKIDAIWNNADNPNCKDKGTEWRKDPCGAWINRKEYGKESDYGW
jgi:hypothetical protein